MDFENKIADKLNGMSMAPSSDIMSKVRQKRTPLYVLTNHIGLHKLRYASISIVVLALCIGPFVLNNNTESGNELVQIENTNNVEYSKEKGVLNKNDLNGNELNVNDEGGTIEEGSFNGEGLDINIKENTIVDSKTSSDKWNLTKIDKTISNKSNSTKNDKIKNNKIVLTNDIPSNNVMDKSDLEGNDLSNDPFVKVGIKFKNNKLKDWNSTPSNSFGENYSKISIIQTDYVNQSNESHDVDKDFDMAAKVRMRFIGVGAGMYGQVLQAENNIPGNAYVNATSYKMTSSYGLNIGFNLTNKWTLQTGVEWFKRDVNFDYLAMSQNQVLKIDTVTGVVHIPGAPDKVVTRYDSSYINDGKHKKYNAVNSITFVELPIAFSYKIWSNRNFTLGVNPGVRLGFLQSSTGYAFNNAGTVENINEEGSNIAYKSLSVSADLGLDLNYRLSRKLDVFMQPKVRQGLGSLLESGSGFTQNYTTFGMFGGLRVRL